MTSGGRRRSSSGRESATSRRRAERTVVLGTALLALALAGPAQAATPFQLTASGSNPDVAVDDAGNGHFVWTEQDDVAGDRTMYCRVPPGGTACNASNALVPTAQDPGLNNDFDGSHVLVVGSVVVILTNRCCGTHPPAQGGDGVMMYVSTDGGSTFGPEQVVGDHTITANTAGGAIFGPGGQISTVSAVSTGGTFYQALTPGQFTTGEANLGDSGPDQAYGGTLALIDANTPIAAFTDLQNAYFRSFGGSGDANNVASWNPTVSLGPGSDTRLAGGPSGVWLMYLVGSPGQTAYVARRFDGSGFGAPVQVSEIGSPIFNDFFQDSAGRLHALWSSTQDRGLTYRVSSDGGATYSAPTVLAAGGRFFNTQLAAGQNGQGWAVWDSNSSTQLVGAVPLEVSTAPPVLGQTVNAQVVSGTVLIGVRGGGSSARAAQKGVQFVPLTQERQVPVGSFLDTKKGRVRITSATPAGATQSGQFFGGVFQVLQARRGKQRGITEARLKGGSFRNCAASRRGKRAAALARRKLSKRTVRRLSGDAKGSHRSRGRHSSATVRGTIWTVVDRCDGTLTRVKRGRVAVRDFRRKRTVVLRAGKRYLARARP